MYMTSISFIVESQANLASLCQESVGVEVHDEIMTRDCISPSEESMEESMEEDAQDEVMEDFPFSTELETSHLDSLSEAGNTSTTGREMKEQPRAEPLYKGSLLSVPASNVLIYKLAMKHNLSNECLSDLLKLIQLHCPTPNDCVGSVYLLKKYFGIDKLKTKFHFFCGTCYITVDEAADLCPNPDCGADLTSNGVMSSFIELSIEQQLQKILSRK